MTRLFKFVALVIPTFSLLTCGQQQAEKAEPSNRLQAAGPVLVATSDEELTRARAKALIEAKIKDRQLQLTAVMRCGSDAIGGILVSEGVLSAAPDGSECPRFTEMGLKEAIAAHWKCFNRNGEMSLGEPVSASTALTSPNRFPPEQCRFPTTETLAAEVTGIQSGANVEYTLTAVPTKVGQKLVNAGMDLRGNSPPRPEPQYVAGFRRYDDGWRVASLDLRRGDENGLR
jgi:hypothetical protein